LIRFAPRKSRSKNALWTVSPSSSVTARRKSQSRLAGLLNLAPEANSAVTLNFMEVAP
jgi:hypothetical protein